jgi:branched-chain amino acid transport system substrate-binding protein
MEALTKRILAIVIIAVIGVGIGVGAWVFLSGGGVYNWSASDAPGAPTDIKKDQIIRLGIIADTERLQGEGSYNGAELAVDEINSAGGVHIGNDTYYFGITSENTDEANPILDTSTGVTAARRLINYKKVQYAVGGFRTETVLAYQPLFMDAKVVFINTGAATTSLAQNVLDDYNRFKYFFHPSPQNTTILITELIQLIMFTSLQLSLPVAYGGIGHNISRFSFMREDLAWTELFAGAITNALESNDYWNMTWTGVSIAMPQDATTTQLQGYWDQVENADTQIVIPIFSGAAGLTFSTSYGDRKPHCIPYGINVLSQDSEYWDDTGGRCNYGVTMESAYNTNKTPLTIPFVNSYTAEYGVSPVYTATGSYDAVYQLAWAIEEGQSLDPDDIVTALESLNRSDPLIGAGGGVAYTPSHCDYYQWPMGIGLAIQWVNGSKTLVPGLSVYPSDPWSVGLGIPPFGTLINMVPLALPDWGLYYFDTEY